jgi:hypothetical protein
MKILFLLACLLFSTSFAFAQGVITNETVIEMSKNGLSSEIIKAKIKASETKFDTSTEAIKKMTEAGVAEPVIVAMIEKQDSQKQTAKQEQKENSKISDSIPEQGNLSDIVGKKKVYIYSEDLKSRDIIIKELNKSKLFEVVDKLEDSDFAIKFEVWIESVGAVANRNGNTTTVSNSQVRKGVLTILMPSENSNRVRFIYSAKKTQTFVFNDHPAESTTKQFIKDLSKLTEGQ